MSRRPVVLVSHKIPCDGGESPNAFVPHITVEIRVAYPPHTVEQHTLLHELFKAYREARGEIVRSMATHRPLKNSWLTAPNHSRIERLGEDT